MTIGEFKAFVEGVGVPDGDCPTIQQWERIKEKIDKLQDDPKPVMRGPDPVAWPFEQL